jgi:hypothetical protein
MLAGRIRHPMNAAVNPTFVYGMPNAEAAPVETGSRILG